MVRTVGTDEAGRGPVIGPLVMCGVAINEGQEKALLDLGVKDSKLLTPVQRQRIAAELKKKFDFHLVLATPAEVDTAVQSDSKDVNLNWLEAEKLIEIAEKLVPEKLIIDCPSPNCNAFTSFLRERLPDKRIKIIGEHKADARYPVVAAASIIAKTARDAEIDKIKKKIGIDFGSGYVADPRTKAFLEKSWDKYPKIFRHSWAPYKKIVKEMSKEQQKLDKY